MSQLLVLPHLDPGRDRRTMTVGPRTSVAEMVALAFPGLPASRLARVTIGEHVIAPELWHRVRPREGATVVIRLVPQGSDTLRSILTVAVLVAAVAAGQFYAPELAGALLPGSFTGFGAATATAGTISAVGSLATAGFALAGSLLLNALIPAPSLSDPGNSTSLLAITGLQNSANPGGVIPSILGRHRYAPPYAAPPYTEVIGNDQYVIAAFLFGHGPLNLYNHQLGDTPIGNFADVQIEIRQGLPGDTPLTLYPQQVIEDSLSINLRQDAGPISRFTARDVTEVSVDLTFAQGLVYIDDKGRNSLVEVDVQIRQRKVGDVAWTSLGISQFIDKTRQPLRRSVRWTLPERGQYEIELTRISSDYDDRSSIIARSDWTAIRSFRPESPFNYDEPVAMVALRVRASNQLNGVINNYNAVAALLCADWDSASSSWIVRETSNPASLSRYAWQGPANVRPKADAELDLDKFADWHEFCAAKGLTYNRVHDYNATRLEVLRDISAAGRATPQDPGSKWGVVIDRPQETYVSAISPRNSWDFQGATPYPLFPDAFRVRFIDATGNWNQAERIVPFPGIDPDTVEVTEDLDLPGVTNPDQVWRAARRRQYELIHRPHSYTVSQDWESLVLTRGDLAPLNHDVLDRDQVAARIRSIDGQLITLDTAVTMQAGRSYALVVRLADGSSVRRSVITLVEGETAGLSLVGDLGGIAPGDMALFGTTVKGPAIDVVVKNVERGDNLTARLTLVDAAPQIDELTDAEVPPAWDGRVGEVIDVSALVPGVPVITDISTDAATGAIAVSIVPGGGVAVPATYVVSHRIHGGGSFTVMAPIAASVGVQGITGYLATDAVDIKVRAVSTYGVSSADSAVQVRTGFVAFSSGFTNVAAGTSYLGANGAFASEASAHVTMVACTINTLNVMSAIAPGGSETFTYTLRKNNADTALTCVISGAAQSAQDVAHSVAFAAGDTADIKLVVSGAAAATTHDATILLA